MSFIRSPIPLPKSAQILIDMELELARRLNMSHFYLIQFLCIFMFGLLVLYHLNPLPIRGRLLDHDRTIRDDTLEMMATYLRVDLGLSLKHMEDTRGCHAIFQFLERLYA